MLGEVSTVLTGSAEKACMEHLWSCCLCLDARMGLFAADSNPVGSQRKKIKSQSEEIHVMFKDSD